MNGSLRVKKTTTSCWVKQGRTHAYVLCLKFLTFANNSRTPSSAQIKFISGDSFNFTFFSGGMQTCQPKKLKSGDTLFFDRKNLEILPRTGRKSKSREIRLMFPQNYIYCA